MDYYNEFRSKIDEKCGLVDELVKNYTLKIQPKLRKLTDKIEQIKL